MFLSKNSNGTYYLFFLDDLGKRHKVSTGCAYKSDALKFLQTFKDNDEERKIKLRRTSLKQFEDDFIGYSRTIHTFKTRLSFEVAFRQFREYLGDVPLQKIGVREIEAFLANKTKEASVWTARKYYTALASAFETAKRWQLLSQNAFRKVQKPRAPEIQPLYFSRKELQEVLKLVKDKDLQELYICAVNTGLRLGEIINLQWIDVDFLRRVITIQNSETFITKSKKNRVVPMNEQLLKMLALRKERVSNELVFHRNGMRYSAEFVSKQFKKAVVDAKVNEKLHFHSLRHTFATWLVQDGVPIYEVQKLLGHSSISVTQVYSHLAACELHSAVNKIDLNLN